MIPLMKNTFINEKHTKDALIEFIREAKKLSMDEHCRLFEKEFSSFQGSKDSVLFNSGGSANLAILQTLKNLDVIKEGDKIAFSSLTWSTNVMPIIQLGFEPVPVDCDKNTLNVMSYNLQETLETTNDIKVFFITNVLGFAGDINNIRDICKNKNIILLEDNCESLGTELSGGKTGNFGDMSSFSFFVGHHMSTIEGGMVCTDNEEYAQMLRIVRANGWDRNLTALQKKKWRKKHDIYSELQAKYTFYDLGYNFRPTEITGFLGREQLKFIDESIKKREDNYLVIEKIIEDNPELIVIERGHISLLSNFAIPILSKNIKTRDFYLSQFSGAGIEIRPIIAGNIQNQPFFKKYISKQYNLPNTQFIHENGFYCGNYVDLTELDLQTISSCLNR